MQNDPFYAPSEGTKMRKFAWNFKNISFFVLSVIVLLFAITASFVNKSNGEAVLSRDQALGMIATIITANMPSPLLDFDKKTKKKYYMPINQPPAPISPIDRVNSGNLPPV